MCLGDHSMSGNTARCCFLWLRSVPRCLYTIYLTLSRGSAQNAGNAERYCARCSAHWKTSLRALRVGVTVSEGEIPGGVIAGSKGMCICHLSRYCNLSCIGFLPISFFIIKVRVCHGLTNVILSNLLIIFA